MIGFRRSELGSLLRTGAGAQDGEVKVEVMLDQHVATAAVAAGAREEPTGWLCPTRADRARLMDGSPAVRKARILAWIFCAFAVIAMAPLTNWWPVLMTFSLSGQLVLVDRLLVRSKRPERPIAWSYVGYVGAMLAGVAVTGGAVSPLLPWVAIPVVTAAARFRITVFLTGALLAGLALVVTVLLTTPPIHHGAGGAAALIGVIALLGSLVVVQQPLLDAELRWRRDAILDPLTGLLNRQGLHRRFREVTEQARLLGYPLSMIVFDLDDFKSLNDEHGHARGDAVLKDVAYLLRKELRSFELLYRIGGEELLLVLPGADLAEAVGVAEQVRAAVEAAHPAGLLVTLSAGVASASGAEISFDPLFLIADRCLYEAKRAGRNRVGYAAGPGADAEAIIAPRGEGAAVPGIPGVPSRASVRPASDAPVPEPVVAAPF